MLHTLWSLLNIFMFLYFGYLCFGLVTRGKKIVQTWFKNLSIAVLVLGFFQILLLAVNDGASSKQFELYKNYNKKSRNFYETVKLEDHLFFNTFLSVQYSEEAGGNIPVSASSFIDGFLIGFDWELITVNVNQDKYNAHCTLHWKLFGIKLYTQSKTYVGVID